MHYMRISHMKQAVIHGPKWKKLKNIKRVGEWCYQSLEENLMEEKTKKEKKDQGERQNENFLWFWIGQRPREKRRQQLNLKEKQEGDMWKAEKGEETAERWEKSRDFRREQLEKKERRKERKRRKIETTEKWKEKSEILASVAAGIKGRKEGGFKASFFWLLAGAGERKKRGENGTSGWVLGILLVFLLLDSTACDWKHFVQNPFHFI